MTLDSTTPGARQSQEPVPASEEVTDSDLASSQRPTISDLMILVAGIALGFWIATVVPRESRWRFSSIAEWNYLGQNVLWGLAIVGLPLLFRGRSQCRTWGLGEWLWFANGVAAWLLAPPILIIHARGVGVSLVNLGAVFALVFVFPLSALAIALTLLLGGWPTLPWRTRNISWKGRVGAWLGLLGAFEGIVCLVLTYRDAIFH